MYLSLPRLLVTCVVKEIFEGFGTAGGEDVVPPDARRAANVSKRRRRVRLPFHPDEYLL